MSLKALLLAGVTAFALSTAAQAQLNVQPAIPVNVAPATGVQTGVNAALIPQTAVGGAGVGVGVLGIGVGAGGSAGNAAQANQGNFQGQLVGTATTQNAIPIAIK